MNKLLKAAIAGAAGISLLLGGAGTFALWNAGVTSPGGRIVAGNLDVSTVTTRWELQHGTGGATSPVSDISTVKIVPGDILTYSSTVKVTALGNNLVGSLVIAPGSITAASAKTEDTELARLLTNSATLTVPTGAGIETDVSAPNTYTVTAGAAGVAQNVDSVITITFPKSATAGAENGAKLGTVNLSGVGVTLVQK